MALTGGVSLIISPLLYLGMSQADMLSPSGKCYVFDQRANGLVPGEAVAVVLLKPLSNAISDEDHIYGVIKASGVNYDGKTNGITAPNPLSQAELIKNIYDKYHINPDNIQYVMSHSVGSKLGDPIEIEALTNAFNKYTDKKQYCTIGSIKPLIGHTFAASGVVSLIGMLMAMKYQTIPASHNYESDSEYINFKKSPFILDKENQIWAAKNNQPRLGVIGTTGISGTNAHAVIEEYLPPREETIHIPSTTSPQVVVFSAKNPDRLQAVVQQMLEFIELQKEFSLANFAYTLQVGREAMEYRAAMLVSNQEELVRGMKEYLKSIKEKKEPDTSIPIFTGNLEENPSGIRNLLAGKVGETVVQVLLAEKNLVKLVLHWTQGGKIPWESLHEGESVRRISLPTYPFARERYWISWQQEKKGIASTIKELLPGKEDSRQHYPGDTPGYVTRLIKEILGLSSNFTINPKKQLTGYGMDSISGIQLHDKIKQELGIQLDSRRFFSEFTLQEIIRQIETFEPLLPSTSHQEIISPLPWEIDKELPKKLILPKKVTPFKHNSSPKHVFLTGITGLLGAFLCDELLQKTSATVFCLVRAKSKSLALKRIRDNLKKYDLWKTNYRSRIIPVLGDLTKPQLGIQKKLYNELSRSVETIYHCAALINHLLNYHALKASNVDGTLSIVEFAGNKQVKPIHFISSYAVCCQADETLLPFHQFETPLDHGNNLISGYAQTKWVSEHHLLQAREQGIPITIFRSGQITVSSQTGCGIADDFFHNFLKIFSEVEVVPQWDERVFQIVPVDYACQAIIAVSQQNNCYGKIYHLTNPNPIPVQDFFDFLQKKSPSLLKVSFEEWADCCLQYIDTIPEGPKRTIFMSLFTKQDSGQRGFEYFFYKMGLSHKNIRKALKRAEVQFPKLDEKWWEKCMNQIALFDVALKF